jgi:hypothetical protein
VYFVQVSPSSVKVNKSTLQTNITSLNHVPTKASWDLSVTKALQMIKGRHSELVKVSKTFFDHFYHTERKNRESIIAMMEMVTLVG